VRTAAPASSRCRAAMRASCAAPTTPGPIASTARS
jgi:hypothetical protein